MEAARPLASHFYDYAFLLLQCNCRSPATTIACLFSPACIQLLQHPCCTHSGLTWPSGLRELTGPCFQLYGPLSAAMTVCTADPLEDRQWGLGPRVKGVEGDQAPPLCWAEPLANFTMPLHSPVSPTTRSQRPYIQARER